ncbi:MAG: DUF1266 domain-containing protein [Acidobacteria bacterium]|nr:DUF1266 domain-containing protein [Acidobacteriota bacterium]
MLLVASCLQAQSSLPANTGDIGSFTPAEQWVLASTAVQARRNGMVHHRMEGFVKVTKRALFRSFMASWDIKSKEDFFRTLPRVNHRADFLEMTDMSVQELDRAIAREPLGVRRNRLLFARRHRDSPYKDRILVAWDLTRYIMLCRVAYGMGWLTAEEFWARVMPKAQTLQRTYNSWVELHADYTRAYLEWSTEKPDDRGLGETAAAFSAYLRDPESLSRRVRWDTDLGGAPAKSEPVAVAEIAHFPHVYGLVCTSILVCNRPGLNLRPLAAKLAGCPSPHIQYETNTGGNSAILAECRNPPALSVQSGPGSGYQLNASFPWAEVASSLRAMGVSHVMFDAQTAPARGAQFSMQPGYPVTDRRFGQQFHRTLLDLREQQPDQGFLRYGYSAGFLAARAGLLLAYVLICVLLGEWRLRRVERLAAADPSRAWMEFRAWQRALFATVWIGWATLVLYADALSMLRLIAGKEGILGWPLAGVLCIPPAAMQCLLAYRGLAIYRRFAIPITAPYALQSAKGTLRAANTEGTRSCVKARAGSVLRVVLKSPHRPGRPPVCSGTRVQPVDPARCAGEFLRRAALVSSFSSLVLVLLILLLDPDLLGGTIFILVPLLFVLGIAAVVTGKRVLAAKGMAGLQWKNPAAAHVLTYLETHRVWAAQPLPNPAFTHLERPECLSPKESQALALRLGKKTLRANRKRIDKIVVLDQKPDGYCGIFASAKGYLAVSRDVLDALTPAELAVMAVWARAWSQAGVPWKAAKTPIGLMSLWVLGSLMFPAASWASLPAMSLLSYFALCSALALARLEADAQTVMITGETELLLSALGKIHQMQRADTPVLSLPHSLLCEYPLPVRQYLIRLRGGNLQIPADQHPAGDLPEQAATPLDLGRIRWYPV